MSNGEFYSIPLEASDVDALARLEAEAVPSQTYQLLVSPGGISIPMADTPIAPSTPTKQTAEEKFRRLADGWRKETRHLSSLSKIAMNSNYQKIIGMGYDAVPFILRDLKDNGGHWLWALFAITEEDPSPDDATFEQAKTAWVEWGKSKTYLSY